MEGTDPAWRWIEREGGTQDPRHRLEAGFGDVVVVGAVEVGDMQGDAGMLGERLEELAHQLGVEAADFGGAEGDIPDQEGTAGDVDGGARQRLVHGKVERSVADDAAPLAERLRQGLAERNAGVLDGVVIVDVRSPVALTSMSISEWRASCSSIWSKKPTPVAIAARPVPSILHRDGDLRFLVLRLTSAARAAGCEAMGHFRCVEAAAFYQPRRQNASFGAPRCESPGLRIDMHPTANPSS